MKLSVVPTSALADVPVRIEVSELAPEAMTHLQASMALPWAPTVAYRSEATFRADPAGRVDLGAQRPESGSYDWIDPMGLITSMTRAHGNLGDIASGVSAEHSLLIDIEAQVDGDTERISIERRFVSANVRTERISHPFVGQLFYTNDATNPTVIVPTGSGGDLGACLPIAALLASHGLNALALNYFHEPGLPGSLARIPLEYFERVFAWLADHPVVNGREVQILGISKGGELALLLASRYPVVKRVVGLAPNAWCFQGLNFRNQSSWTHEGKDLPYVRLLNRWVIRDMLDGFLHDHPFQFTQTYVRGVHQAHNLEEARIKLEDSRADLLLMAGDKDGMWNASAGCAEIVDVLRRRGYPHAVQYQEYAGAGHSWYPPFVLPCSETTAHMGPRLTLDTGGSLQANAHAQADSWERALAFLAGASGS